MEIVKIDPDEKYVLLLPGASQEKAEQVVTALRAFMEDDVHVIFAIYGLDVTVVPVDQVMGYKTFDD